MRISNFFYFILFISWPSMTPKVKTYIINRCSQLQRNCDILVRMWLPSDWPACVIRWNARPSMCWNHLDDSTHGYSHNFAAIETKQYPVSILFFCFLLFIYFLFRILIFTCTVRRNSKFFFFFPLNALQLVFYVCLCFRYC